MEQVGQGLVSGLNPKGSFQEWKMPRRGDSKEANFPGMSTSPSGTGAITCSPSLVQPRAGATAFLACLWATACVVLASSEGLVV